MPAKGSDDLYKLIKALSPAEKGYFKKFADRYSFSEKDNNYLKLFELIDAQEEYDEKDLQKHSFVNQLPRQKNYLQNMILRSLQMYDAEASVVIEFENSIQQVRSLISRGQFDLARKLLLKTKKEALEEECFLEALKLVRLETFLNKRSGLDKDLETERLLYAERYSLSEKDKNFDEVQELEQQVIMFTRNSYSKNATLKSKMLNGDYPLLSRKAKITFYNTLSVYYNFIRDYEKQYIYSKEHIKLKKEEYRTADSLPVFMNSYTNFFFACYANRRYNECSEVLAQMQQLPIRNEKENEQRERKCMIIQTYLYIGTGKFEEGLACINAFFEKSKDHEELITQRMDVELKRNIALIYFANGLYKNCLRLLDTLLSSHARDYAGSMYFPSLLLNILVHYELGNRETTEHLIVSARRAFKNNNKLGSLEEIMLGFLKKHMNSESNTSLITTAINDLTKAAQEADYHSHTSLYSFCLCWLESKLNKRSLAEMIKERAKKEAGKNYWQ